MSRRGRRGKEGRRKRQTCRCAQVDEGSAVSSRVDARRRDVAHVHLASATVAPDVVSKRDCCRLAELQWHAMRAGGVSRAGCGGKDGSAGTLEAGRVMIVLATTTAFSARAVGRVLEGLRQTRARCLGILRVRSVQGQGCRSSGAAGVQPWRRQGDLECRAGGAVQVFKY